MRTTVKAKHRGKVIVWEISEIVHFHYQDKYAVSHHEDGRELLLDDSITGLEAEFSDLFIRTSRADLVSRYRLIRVEHRPSVSCGVVHVAGAREPIQLSRSCMRAVKEYLRSKQEIAQ